MLGILHPTSCLLCKHSTHFDRNRNTKAEPSAFLLGESLEIWSTIQVVENGQNSRGIECHESSCFPGAGYQFNRVNRLVIPLLAESVAQCSLYSHTNDILLNLYLIENSWALIHSAWHGDQETSEFLKPSTHACHLKWWLQRVRSFHSLLISISHIDYNVMDNMIVSN